MKKLITSLMVVALLAVLSVPAFAVEDVGTSTSISNETSHIEVETEAENDMENEVENEAAEIENEGADK